MTPAPKLSPTSYALLGLLARGPHSAYELNAVMQRSAIRAFWTRAESHVYSEPKKLLRHGLVEEHGEEVKGRKRTVYTITDEGRSELKRWLERDSNADLRIQAEFMLKLILAEFGEAADLSSTLNEAFTTSREDLQRAIAGIRPILSSAGSNLEGMPFNGIAVNLLADILVARYNWGRYALEATGPIDDSTSREDKTAAGLAAYAEALEKMEQALTDQD